MTTTPDAPVLACASNVLCPPPRLRLSSPRSSPHLAARGVGVEIDLDEVHRWVEGVEADWMLIESAGGAFSPLGPTWTNADLAARLQAHFIVLVAPDRLGVLHDVTATLMALRAGHPALAAPLVVLNRLEADASTGSNASELARVVFPARGFRSRVASFADGADAIAQLLLAEARALGGFT